MNTITSTRHETNDHALRRLLQVAQESGVRLLQDDRGNYWCTSASEPSLIHAVTPTSCSCRGFSRAARCRHVAALLSHLGQIDPDPEPPAAVACPACQGAGVLEVVHTRWVGGSRTGYRDVWSESVLCPSCGEELLAA